MSSDTPPRLPPFPCSRTTLVHVYENIVVAYIQCTVQHSWYSIQPMSTSHVSPFVTPNSFNTSTSMYVPGHTGVPDFFFFHHHVCVFRCLSNAPACILPTHSVWIFTSTSKRPNGISLHGQSDLSSSRKVVPRIIIPTSNTMWQYSTEPKVCHNADPQQSEIGLWGS